MSDSESSDVALALASEGAEAEAVTVDLIEEELQISTDLNRYMEQSMQADLRQVAHEIVLGRLFRPVHTLPQSSTFLHPPKAIATLLKLEAGEPLSQRQLQQALNTYLATQGLAQDGTLTRVSRPLARATGLDVKQAYHIVHVSHAVAARCHN
jgi:hypothetical protein